jgi:hypothetical protein
MTEEELDATWDVVSLPILGEVVYVVPKGAEEMPHEWWRAMLVRIDSDSPHGAFCVRSLHTGEPALMPQWVKTIASVQR